MQHMCSCVLRETVFGARSIHRAGQTWNSDTSKFFFLSLLFGNCYSWGCFSVCYIKRRLCAFEEKRMNFERDFVPEVMTFLKEVTGGKRRNIIIPP